MKMIEINGKKYETPEMDFSNLCCDLEDRGVDIVSMTNNRTRNRSLFSLCRGMVSIITGIYDLDEAGKVLSEHLKKGGSMEDILTVFTDSMQTAGFGEAESATVQPTPQKITEIKPMK